MDWIAFALRAYQDGKRPEEILASIPPEERAAAQEALEAAIWLRQRAPVWRKAVAERRPSWEAVQRHLPAQKPVMERRVWRGFGRARLAWALAVALVVLWFGVSQAAARALPGQWAYPLKRGWEEARLRLTRDDIQRLQLEMQFAEERLHEAQALLALGDLTHAEEALAAYQARWEEMVTLGQQLGDESALRGLKQALARHQVILETMAARGAAQPPGLLHALEVLRTNQARLQSLQADGGKNPDAPPERQKQPTPAAPGQDKNRDKSSGKEGDNHDQGQGQGNGQGNGRGNGQGQGQGNGHGKDKGPGQGNNGQGNGNQGQGGNGRHQP